MSTVPETPSVAGIRLETLQQDKTWIDAGHVTHNLEDMSRGYLGNVLSYVQRHAEELYALQLEEDGTPEASTAGGDDGMDEFIRPWDWLEQAPLVLAIKARLA
jgi:hypothetical protein